jgi:hypothetical protein
MRRIGFIVPFFLCFLALAPGTVRGLDLRVVGGAGNLAFDPELESSLGAADKQFEPYLHPLWQIGVEGEFSDLVDFSAAWERDPLLGHRIFANVGINFEHIELDFGPFISPFNTMEQPFSPGIAAALGLEFPGILFGSLKAASTIGTLAVLPGEYMQQTGEIALGFWVPHVICTLSLNTRALTRRESEILLVKDEHTRYQFRADVFTKNVPYTIYIDMGYQSQKRSYIPSGADSVTDELKSVYIGCEGTYRILPSLKLLLGLEIPVYAWAEKPLKGPEKDRFLYQFRGGLIWTLPEKK